MPKAGSNPAVIHNLQVETLYIMGIYKNKLLYFAKITEILSMREYFAPNSQYTNRHDYIYEALPNGDFKRNDNNPKFHPKNDTKRHIRDQSGEYALLSDCFAYWGKECKQISESLIAILPKHRENKHYQSDSDHYKQIMKEVHTLWDFKTIIQNKPHDYPRNQSCKGLCGNENCLVPKRVRHVKRQVC